MDNHAENGRPTPLDPLQISQTITQPYHNRRIAAVNDHEIRMSVMTGGFPGTAIPHPTRAFTPSTAS